MLIILSGVSGAGKDTIKKEIISRVDNVESIPSITDRPIRPGDIPGETYIFVSNEEFKKMIEKNELYEFDVHHNHYYGVPRKILNDKINDGKIVIKDVDVNGTENLVRILKDNMKVITIFLRVPKDILRERLENRIDKPSREEIELRLGRLELEEAKMNNYDYIIDNLDKEKTVKKIIEIINKNKRK